MILRLLVLSFLLSLSALAPAKASMEVDKELRTYLKQAINTTNSFSDRFEAEVWLVDMSGRLSRYIKDKSFRIQFLQTFNT